MAIFGRDDETGAVDNRDSQNVIVALEVNMDNVAGQQADSIHTFVEIITSARKMKAALYDAASPYPLIAQTAERTIAAQVAAWIQFDFVSAPALTASKKYLLAVWSELVYQAAYVKYSAWSAVMRMFYKYSAYAADFPNPLPSGPTISTVDPCIFCTYSVLIPAYPVARLKKGLISGFHSFMNAYLNAKVGGVEPLKLPDGTRF
jgi:hypothetical protein